MVSNFKKLSNKLQRQWKSKESANKIAASIGFKKYWKTGMARKAAAARK